MEPIRACVKDVCRMIDYWIDEADLTLTEISFILQEVDRVYDTEQGEEVNKWKDEDEEEV